MIKLEKEQLPKVIALGVMAAVVLGYAGYSWLGQGSGVATPALAAPPHPSSESLKLKAPGAAEKVLALPPISHENPFQPAFTAESGPSKGPDKPPPPKPTGALGPKLAALPDILNGPAMDSVPGVAGPPSGPGTPPAAQPGSPSSTGGPSHPAAKPEPPKMPAVLVTGILMGPENVAILKWSDTQRQVVRVGDRLDGGYLVKSIRPDAVVLAQGENAWVMHLGTTTKG